MVLQKLLQSSLLNKNKPTKKIKINGEDKEVKSGDILLFYPKEGENFLTKGRFVDVEENDEIWCYIIDTNYNLIDIRIHSNNIVAIEKPS